MVDYPTFKRNRSNKIIKQENKNHADYLVNELIENLLSYGKENFYKFQLFDGTSEKKLSNLRIYILKIIDSYTFYFKINPITSENPYYYLTSLINTNIFSNTKEPNDKYLLKLGMYLMQHFYYFKKKDYNDLEKSDFSFSVTRIPINYQDFFEKHSHLNRKKMLSLLESSEEKKNELISNYSERKGLLMFKYGYYLFKYFKNKSSLKAFNYLCHFYIKLPYESDLHFRNVDYTKSWAYKLAIFTKRELNPKFHYSIGTVKIFNIE